MKLNSPFVVATLGTPKSVFDQGSSRNQSTNDTPTMQIRPSGFSALVKEIHRKGESTPAIQVVKTSPSRLKIFSPILAYSPPKRGDATPFTKLSRIRKIEQKVS